MHMFAAVDSARRYKKPSKKCIRYQWRRNQEMRGQPLKHQLANRRRGVRALAARSIMSGLDSWLRRERRRGRKESREKVGKECSEAMDNMWQRWGVIKASISSPWKRKPERIFFFVSVTRPCFPFIFLFCFNYY